MTASLDLAFVMRAALFAAERHANQRRKGRDQEPYVNHLIEVVHHLAQSSAADDRVLLAAGYLHDTVEDTDTSSEELARHFGADVAHVVAEVTDDKSLRKDARKRAQIDGISRKSPRAQLLSIADKTANVASILRSPPMDWSRQRMSEYGDWSEAVVAQIRGRDAYLEAAFAEALVRLRGKLGE